MTIFGFDISEHQAGIDVARAYEQGYRFVIVRTNQGTYEDKECAAHIKAIRKTPLRLAAYLRVGDSSSPSVNAAKFDKMVDGDKSIPAWIDAEDHPVNEAKVFEVAKELRALGYTVAGSYLPKWYWGQIGRPVIRTGPLWASEYVNGKGGGPTLYGRVPGSFWNGYGNQPVTLLQFSETASVAGVAAVDVSAFRGTQAELEKLFTGSKKSPAKKPAPTPVKADPKPVTNEAPIHPTLNAVHTPFGEWGPSWSWNRGKNNAHPTWGQHGGDDWHRNAGAAEIGDPIVAVADGKVTFAGSSNSLGWGPAFGNHVLITWDDHVAGDPAGKHRTSIDAHMNSVVAKYGQHVKAGDLIGHKGMTGNVTGPHDHHEQHLGQGWGDKRVKPVYPGKTATVSTPAPSTDWLDMATQKEVQAAFHAELAKYFGDVFPSPSLDPASVKKNPNWYFASTVGWLTKLVSLIRRDMPTKKQVDELIQALKETK